METNFALPELKSTNELVSDLKSVGFTVEENRIIPEADILSYQPLKSGDSFVSLNLRRTGPLARRLGYRAIWLMEKVRIVPKGSAAICDMSRKSVESFISARTLDIFTSLFFFLARKL